MPPENRPISALAKENGISEQTLYTWLETARMNEAELAQYCRGKGLFVEQIAGWREACQQAAEGPAERNRKLREQGKNDRREIKQLRRICSAKRTHWQRQRR